MFPNLIQRSFSSDHPEQMDLPDLPAEDLEQDLKNLETINRFFGGQQATRFILKQARLEKTKQTKVLDCACGAGDLTRFLGLALPRSQITAVDLHPQTLEYAKKKNPAPNIAWQQADIKALPYPDHFFDLVTCQLALHHFSHTEAVNILRELKRVSSGSVFVTDLVRSTNCYLGIWFLVHTWLRHPMTRHDALLSVRRAFIEPELRNLATQAGWQHFQSCRLPWYRQALWLEFST